MKIIKSLIVIFLLLLPVVVFGNPDYVELNDLAIIRGIGVSCQEEVSLYLQEIIPIKGDSGISYDYEYYQADGKKLGNAYQKIEEKTKKKLYLSKIDYLVTDCKKSSFILDEFHLKDIKIYHVKEMVLEQLKETKS